jgi:hypothetical protein
MGLNSSSYYVIGPPINYTSIYGYPKRRFEVYQADEKGDKIAAYPVGEIKEEPMLDENGDLSGRCFYTKNLGREHGKYRFYPSPEALIVACGGRALSKPAAQRRTNGDAPLKEPGCKMLCDGAANEASPTHEPSDLEKRLKALEDKVFSAATPRKKASGNSVSRATVRHKPLRTAAAKGKTAARKKKVSS